MPRRSMFLICALILSPLAAFGDFTTTFENTGLAPNSADNNAGPSNNFSIDGNNFNNVYDASSASAYGWAISNQTNTTDARYTNQYSAITGGGAGGSATYAVGFTYGGPATSQIGGDPNSPAYISSNPFHPSDVSINLMAGATPESIQITNTTYSYLSMRNGDLYGFAPAFKQGDYQLLDIRGYDATGHQLGDVNFYLADYRSTDPTQWYLVNTWQTVNLTSLAGSSTLQFGIQSSQNDPKYGVNTPAYFAADNFVFGTTPSVAVPEPTSFVLMATGLVGVAIWGRRRRAAGVLGVLSLGLIPAASVRADYDPQVGQPGSLGIIKTSPAFTEWASSVVSITRGPQDITDPNSPLASFGSPSNALGPGIGQSLTYNVVSLGDGGSITLGFDRPIVNGTGADFAVFENGFRSGATGLAFLELATVAVSSDGIHFFTFPAVSLTQTTTQVGGFDLLDARNLYDLAGKYIAGYGTGFDLSELAGVSPLLNVNDVTEVRVTDVVGSIDPRYGTRDSLGNFINDPFTTPYPTGGFDLNAIGVIHAAAVPEPSSLALVAVALGIGGLVSRRRMVA